LISLPKPPLCSDAYARGIFVEDAYIAGLGGIAAIIVAVAISVCRPARSKVATYDAGASNARVGES
jgi:hypothetical protein